MKIAIDLGGTNMRVGLTDGAKVVETVIEPCPAKETEEVVLSQLKRQIAQLMRAEVTGIGVGVPSVVDYRQGIVYNVANIPAWKEVHLKDILEKKFGVPVAVNNDANCFALGAWRYGEGQGTSDMVGLTMGTGIGSGIIIDGKLYNGQVRARSDHFPLRMPTMSSIAAAASSASYMATRVPTSANEPRLVTKKPSPCGRNSVRTWVN